MRSNWRTGSSRHRSGGRVEACQPLWRKVMILSSKINPYRIVIVLRLVVLCFFLKFRITTPAMDAVPLWLASVICELWFVLSWILNQLPKWSPVTCETVPGPPSLRAARCPSASSPSRPAPPEFYFSQKIDYLKDKVRPTFVKERRAMKREYEEFKVRIAALVSKAQKKPEEGWVMQDGTPWPENNSKAVHEAMCFLMDPRLGKKLLIHP